MDIRGHLMEQCTAARAAGRELSVSSSERRNTVLETIARSLENNIPALLEANALDVAHAGENGIRDVMVDRLTLTDARIRAISAALRKVIALADPIGRGEVWLRPNGLEIRRVKVPIGVLGIIYESRPNVTVDAAALCIKSGNAVILKGGKEAIHSNKALVALMQSALTECGLSGGCVQLIEDTTRESTNVMMRLYGYIDMLIPRGNASLIQTVVDNSSIPVIETGAGNCHIYADRSADLDMAAEIIYNSKCQRPSVCNAAETLLVHRDIAELLLPMAKRLLDQKSTKLYGDEITGAIIPVTRAVTEDDYFAEFNDYELAVKVVSSLEEAVEHINRYSTRHSECIVTTDMEAARKFQAYVDSAAVYVNASTRFTDGEEFGFGAEIGISTGKLHARGPFGLDELTTVKYLINGSGQLRT